MRLQPPAFPAEGQVAGGQFQFTEIAAERELGVIGEVLTVEHQHAEFVHAGGNCRHRIDGTTVG